MEDSALEPVNRFPRFVAIIGWLFIVAGVVGLIYHARKFKFQSPFNYEALWVLFVRILAIVGGAFLLRGANWARWVLLVWIAYHVILSTMHGASELVVHSVIFVVVAYVLLNPRASAYFRRPNGKINDSAKID